ncbi:MAG: nitroreductase family protein [Chloroflexota bacterium]
MSKQEPVFESIKKRRVCRSFDDKPISREDLEHLLWAARWAPGGGNSRLHHFIVVDDKPTIDLIRTMSPGMLAYPTALIVICTDFAKVKSEGVRPDYDPVYLIDVGAASQNMMLAALERGIGSCPTTSFSHSGVRQMLNLPDHLEPEYILQLGIPLPQKRVMRAGVSTKLRLEDISSWGAFPAKE